MQFEASETEDPAWSVFSERAAKLETAHGPLAVFLARNGLEVSERASTVDWNRFLVYDSNRCDYETVLNELYDSSHIEGVRRAVWLACSQLSKTMPVLRLKLPRALLASASSASAPAAPARDTLSERAAAQVSAAPGAESCGNPLCSRPRDARFSLFCCASCQEEFHSQLGAMLEHEHAATAPLVDGLPRGVCGLTNLGNTCYMNAAVQCLANDPLICALAGVVGLDDSDSQMSWSPLVGILRSLAARRMTQAMALHERGDRLAALAYATVAAALAPGLADTTADLRSRWAEDIRTTGEAGAPAQSSARSARLAELVQRASVVLELFALIACMWRGAEPIARPVALHGTLPPSRFGPAAQEDVHDLLLYWLECLQLVTSEGETLDEGESPTDGYDRSLYVRRADQAMVEHGGDLAKAAYEHWRSNVLSRHSALLADQLFGQIRTTRSCTNCGDQLVLFEACTGLVLALDRTHTGPTTLQQCIARYGEEEQLVDARCRRCGQLGTMWRKNVLVRLPNLLVLTIARFCSSAKLDQFVSVPLSLAESDVLGQYDRGARRRTFNLQAVAEHSGTLHSGHYTAKVLAASSTSRWFALNDAYVHASQASDAVSSAAYVLVYRARDDDNVVDDDMR